MSSIKDQIKERVTVSDILGINKGVAVIRCPFPDHEDRNPSFSIYDGGRKWKCFSQCDGGDVFTFWMKLNNVDFRTAFKQLKERSGL